MDKRELYRFILGAVIVVGLLILAAAIGLGKVEEKTSYGLTPVLTILAKVALDFSEWAFRTHTSQAEKLEPPSENPGEGLTSPPR